LIKKRKQKENGKETKIWLTKPKPKPKFLQVTKDFTLVYL